MNVLVALPKRKTNMIGSIIGDIAGAPYEGNKLVQDKRDYRPFFLNGLAKFTDDTNLTIATADAILQGIPFEEKYLEWYRKNPKLGYGSRFVEWAEAGGKTVLDSRGNGAAMRVSPIVLFATQLGHTENGEWVGETFERQLDWALNMTAMSTAFTHNCDESRNGAMGIVVAMLLASQKFPKDDIKSKIEKLTGYNLDVSVEEVREKWEKRDCRCDITVPQALICFLNSTDFDDCIRLSVWSKGDVDTIAAMAGGIAEWFYGVETINPGILAETKLRLQPEMIDIVNQAYNGKLKW